MIPAPSRRAAILWTGAAMTAFLAGAILTRAAAVAGGEELVFAVEGVDPRDLLAGHFVRLRLVPDEAFTAPGEAPPEAGRALWVRLAPLSQPQRWAVRSATTRRPALAPGEVAVRARAGPSFAAPEQIAAGGVRFGLDYGIDRIYQSAALARRIERLLAAGPTGEVALIVSRQGDGWLLPKAVMVGAARADLATLT